MTAETLAAILRTHLAIRAEGEYLAPLVQGPDLGPARPMTPDEFAADILAALPVSPTDGLDAAWARAEAALPNRRDGGKFDMSGGIGLSLYRMNERTYRAEWGADHFDERTPTAALNALAARLEVTRESE